MSRDSEASLASWFYDRQAIRGETAPKTLLALISDSEAQISLLRPKSTFEDRSGWRLMVQSFGGFRMTKCRNQRDDHADGYSL